MDDGRAGILAEGKNAFDSGFSITQELKGNIFVVFGSLGVLENPGHLQVVFPAEHELHIVETLFREQRQSLFAHLEDLVTLKFTDTHTFLREEAILRLVLAQLEHRRIFEFCCHSFYNFCS